MDRLPPFDEHGRDRDAHDPAQLAHIGDDDRRLAELLRRQMPQGREAQGRQHQPQADAADDRRGDDLGKADPAGQPTEQPEGQAEQRQPGTGHRQRRMAIGHLAGQRNGQGQRDARRQQGEARRRGLVMQRVLHEDRDQIRRGIETEAIDERDHRAHREAAPGEQAEVDDRVRRVPRMRDEGRHAQQRQGELPPSPDGRGATVLQAGDALDQGQRRHHQQAHPAPVEAAPDDGPRQGQQVQSEQAGQQAGRHVEQEDRLPAETVEQHAAQARRDGRREDDAEAEDARGHALALHRKQTHHSQRAQRLQHTGGQALQDAHADDETEIRRLAARQAGAGQDQQGDQEEAAKAQPVEQPGRRQHRHRHRRHEAGHRPLHLLLADAEMARQGRHGNGEAGRRQHPADHPEPHHQQHQPLVARAETQAQIIEGLGAGQEKHLDEPERKAIY